MADPHEDARRRIEQLYVDLQRLHERDPEQQVLEDVLPVLDAVLGVARASLPDDPVLREVRSFYTARAASDDDIRAAEALLIVGSVRSAIPPVPPVGPATARVQVPDQENPMKMRW